MDILGLSTSPGTGGAYALILSEVEGNRRLPIIIGTFEAQAIALELEHIKPPRPMTHDLLKNVVQSFNAYVKNIFINDLSEGTFYAQIVYEDENGGNLEQDARPSDAIALAIRFNAPIFVPDTILNEAGIVSEEGEEDDIESALSGQESEPGTEEGSYSSGSSGKGEEESAKTELDELQRDLKSAIENEDYEKAAKIRDQINKLKQ